MLFWIIFIIIVIWAIGAISNNTKRTLVEMEQVKVKKVRPCPTCAESVQLEAIVCRFCGEDLPLLTDAEREEIEESYLAEVESLDPDIRRQRANSARKAKNKSDWKNT